MGREESGDPYVVNNPHTFAIEKKAQRKRGMLILKYNIKSYML
jgi:hypothetical protein